MKLVLGMVSMIQILHLWIIVTVISNTFTVNTYGLVLVITVLLIVIILAYISKILDMGKNIKDKSWITVSFDPAYQELQTKLQSVEKQRDGLQRELKKKTTEEGEF